MRRFMSILLFIGMLFALYMMFTGNARAWSTLNEPNPPTYQSSGPYSGQPYYQAPRYNAPQYPAPQYGASQYSTPGWGSQRGSRCTSIQNGQTTFTRCW